jgi:hypothetical protein
MDESTLFNKYPLIFRAAISPRRYPSLPIAHWGIECGQGWYPIIEDLAAWLENEALALKARKKRPPVMSQVKEKFGVITIYINGFPSMRFFEELYPRLEAAYAKSKTVCEICGEPGTFRGDGWMRMRCDKCEAERRISNE